MDVYAQGFLDKCAEYRFCLGKSSSDLMRPPTAQEEMEIQIARGNSAKAIRAAAGMTTLENAAKASRMATPGYRLRLGQAAKSYRLWRDAIDKRLGRQNEVQPPRQASMLQVR